MPLTSTTIDQTTPLDNKTKLPDNPQKRTPVYNKTNNINKQINSAVSFWSAWVQRTMRNARLNLGLKVGVPSTPPVTRISFRFVRACTARLLGFNRFHLDSLGSTWSQLVSFGFTWIHSVVLVSLGLSWFHVDSLGLTWSHSVSLNSLDLTMLLWVTLRFARFRSVTLGFSWSHLVSFGLTWFHLVSLGFT